MEKRAPRQERIGGLGAQIGRKPVEFSNVQKKMKELRPKIAEVFEYDGKRWKAAPGFVDSVSAIDDFNVMNRHRNKLLNEIGASGGPNWVGVEVLRLIDGLSEGNMLANIKQVHTKMERLQKLSEKSGREIDGAYERIREINKGGSHSKNWDDVLYSMQKPVKHVQGKLKKHDILEELENLISEIKGGQ